MDVLVTIIEPVVELLKDWDPSWMDLIFLALLVLLAFARRGSRGRRNVPEGE